MCVPLVLAKQKKSKEVKWARSSTLKRAEKDQTEGRKKEPAIVSSSSSSSSNTPANVIISVHVREEILGHRLEGKYMF